MERQPPDGTPDSRTYVPRHRAKPSSDADNRQSAAPLYLDHPPEGVRVPQPPTPPRRTQGRASTASAAPTHAAAQHEQSTPPRTPDEAAPIQRSSHAKQRHYAIKQPDEPKSSQRRHRTSSDAAPKQPRLATRFHQRKQTPDAPYQPVGYHPEKIDKANDASAPVERTPKQAAPKRAIRWQQLVLLCVCGVVFLVSAGLLISYGLDWYNAQRVSEELRTLYHEEDVVSSATADVATPTAQPAATATVNAAVFSPTETPYPRAQATATRTTTAPYSATGNPASKFAELQKRNGEILGWLTIEGVVDEPVVKLDNAFYLTHNYLGKRSNTGALFFDEHVNLYPAPENIVIHGHNMKTGAMFGSLKLYKVKGAAFLRDAGIIQLDTVMESAKYAVFAVAEADVRPNQPDFLNFCGALSFPTDSAFSAYVEQVRAFSMVYVPLDVAPTDRLLTLSTCAGEDDNKRLLVFARMVRDDETELALNYAFGHATNR